MCMPHFVYLFIWWTLAVLHLLAVVHNAVVNVLWCTEISSLGFLFCDRAQVAYSGFKLASS